MLNLDKGYEIIAGLIKFSVIFSYFHFRFNIAVKSLKRKMHDFAEENGVDASITQIVKTFLV